MKKGSTFFLRGVIVLLCGGALALCAFLLPHLIGSIEFTGYDPILLGLYVPAIPFFVALFQAWKLLNYIDTDEVFSESSANALKYIKYCAAAISGLFVAGMPYIWHVANQDDAPGVVLIACSISGTSLVIGVFAALLQKLLQKAVEIKSENDLTV